MLWERHALNGAELYRSKSGHTLRAFDLLELVFLHRLNRGRVYALPLTATIFYYTLPQLNAFVLLMRCSDTIP